MHSRIARSPVGPPSPAVFLDRDGVIAEDSGYLGEASALRLIPGAAEAIAALNLAGWPVVMVTNQSGIGRGYYSWDKFEEVQAELTARLAEKGGKIDGTWACAFHRDGLGEYRVPDHPCRKPNPGMLHQAMSAMNLLAEGSWMVGDKISDVEAGLRAGVSHVVHVLTGYGKEQAEAVLAMRPVIGGAGQPLTQCADLSEAVSLILGRTEKMPGVTEQNHE